MIRGIQSEEEERAAEPCAQSAHAMYGLGALAVAAVDVA